ncbi:MAG: T9SS type A sorting domain-containing protein [Saprospiraceae bacterium]|nr:T9SS type A sorting domain-containing protein [Saprospiraceae bacterium]
MKQFLPIFLLLLSGFTSYGQLESGTLLPGNIRTTDIKGDSVDVFKWLAEGKTVVLDIFATWCGPCWSFHNSGYLKQLHEQYGPQGTDELRIVAIESDGTTAESELYNSALGNWTTGVKYPIVNNHTFSSLLKISFFPTLYIIRPNKRVFEVGSYRGNNEVWQKAMFPKKPIDLLTISGMTSRTFCNNASFDQKPTLLNLGSEDITSLKADFIRNGQVQQVSNAAAIPVFSEIKLPLPNISQFSVTTLFEAIVKEINGNPLPENEQLKFTSTYLRPVVETDAYRILFTTDFYPGEITWELKDNKGKSILKNTYNPGPGQFGSGGEDAHKTFTHDILLEDTDISCLTLSISDTGQDGLTSFNPNVNPVPGVEIQKIDGTVIKPKMDSDYTFTSTRNILTKFILSSNATEVVADKFSIFPNPTSGILNISNSFEDFTDYTIHVTDMMGKQITPTYQNVNFVDITNFNAGIYFINIFTDKGNAAFKFMKQ